MRVLKDQKVALMTKGKEKQLVKMQVIEAGPSTIAGSLFEVESVDLV